VLLAHAPTIWEAGGAAVTSAPCTTSGFGAAAFQGLLPAACVRPSDRSTHISALGTMVIRALAMRLQVDHIGRHALTDADVADLAAAATAGDMPTVTPTATWEDLGFVPISPSGFDPWRPLSESPLVESPARAQSPVYHSASSGWCNLWGGDDAMSSCASSPAWSPRGSPAWDGHWG